METQIENKFVVKNVRGAGRKLGSTNKVRSKTKDYMADNLYLMLKKFMTRILNSDLYLKENKIDVIQYVAILNVLAKALPKDTSTIEVSDPTKNITIKFESTESDDS